MNKLLKTVLPILVIALIFTFVPKAYAANLKVNTLDASISNGKITVSGTTEAGMMAVAITVYKDDGTTLVAMKTSQVSDTNTYLDSVEVANGTYVVKVADYEGGDFVTKTVTVENSTIGNTTDENTTANETNSTEENATNESTSSASASPKTGDNIVFLASLFAIAMIGFIVTKKYNKNMKKTRKH